MNSEKITRENIATFESIFIYNTEVEMFIFFLNIGRQTWKINNPNYKHKYKKVLADGQ